MAASLLLRAARRRQLASPLGTVSSAPSRDPSCQRPVNICCECVLQMRWFCKNFQPTGNEVTGTDLGTTNSCMVMEGKEGQTDYTDEMWTKDQEEIKRLKAEYEENIKTFHKQMDVLSELERCEDEELARLKKKLDRIERICSVTALICVPVIVVGVLNIMS